MTQDLLYFKKLLKKEVWTLLNYLFFAFFSLRSGVLDLECLLLSFFDFFGVRERLRDLPLERDRLVDDPERSE